MTYPCFTYAFKFMAAGNFLVTYTTRERITKYHRLRMRHELIWNMINYSCMVLHPLSTFLLAIQDKTEFLERLVESIAMLILAWEYFVVKRDRFVLIQLVNEMKSKFSTADASIVKKCGRAEAWYYLAFITTTGMGIFLALYEVVLMSSEDRILRKGALYHYRNPERHIPANIYIPSLLPFDLSVQPFYTIYMAALNLLAICCVLTAGLTMTLLGTFSIHIQGQYEMLLDRMKLVNRHNPSTSLPRKFYTNIISGEYFTRDPLNSTGAIIYSPRLKSDKSKNEEKIIFDRRTMEIIGRILLSMKTQRRQDCHKSSCRGVPTNGSEISLGPRQLECQDCQEQSSLELKTDVYDEILIKQIIQYHQFLLYFRKKVQSFLQPVSIPICFAFILLVALDLLIIVFSEYKLAYIACLAAIIMHLASLIEFSDSIDRLNSRLQQQLFFNTAWYEKPASYWSLLSSAIQQGYRSEHFSFYAGFVTYDRALLLALFTRSYKICNWLFYMHWKTNKAGF